MPLHLRDVSADHTRATGRRRPALMLPLAVIALAGLLAACTAPWSSQSHGPLTIREAMARLQAAGFTGIRPSVRPLIECAPSSVGLVAKPAPDVRRPRYSLTFKDPRTPGLLGVWAFSDSDSRFAADCVRGGLYSALHQTFHNEKPTRRHQVSPHTVVVGEHRAGYPGTAPTATGNYQTLIASGPVVGLGDSQNRPQSVRIEADLERALRALTE